MEGKNSPNKKHRDKNKPVAHCKKKKKKAFQTSISSMKKKKTIVRATSSTLNYVLECYDHKPYRSFEKQNAM